MGLLAPRCTACGYPTATERLFCQRCGHSLLNGFAARSTKKRPFPTNSQPGPYLYVASIWRQGKDLKVPITRLGYLRFARKATRLLLVGVLISFIISGGLNGSHAPGAASGVFTILGVACALAICFLWIPLFLHWGYEVGSAVGTSIAVAAQPVLTPQQIAERLRAEWKREPTVQEVAAVQQILLNEHNQALLTAGIGLGSLYVIHQTLHK